jgi:lipid-A-disaccharide synthase
VSGDLAGAGLARALRSLAPPDALRLSGNGGRAMAAAGVDVQEDLVRGAVMGFRRVVARLPSIVALLARIRRRLEEERPDVVVPIDYPGLHFRIAAMARELSIPVAWYVSPQIWAWASGRIDKIRRLVDRMLVILPFEAPYYAERGVDAVFVGHPAVDRLAAHRPDPSLDAVLRGPLVGILPGSREQEIRAHLGVFLEAAARLAATQRGLRFAIPYPGEDARAFERIRRAVARSAIAPRAAVLRGGAYDVMRRSRIALVASGTATLELAVLGVPMVILYRTGRLASRLGKRLLRTEHIGLANILAGKRAVPEFLTGAWPARDIAEAAARLLRDGDERERAIADLRVVRDSLGPPGSAARAAAEVARCAGLAPVAPAATTE